MHLGFFLTFRVIISRTWGELRSWFYVRSDICVGTTEPLNSSFLRHRVVEYWPGRFRSVEGTKKSHFSYFGPNICPTFWLTIYRTWRELRSRFNACWNICVSSNKPLNNSFLRYRIIENHLHILWPVETTKNIHFMHLGFFFWLFEWSYLVREVSLEVHLIGVCICVCVLTNS